VKKLKDADVHVYEKEKNSNIFDVTIPKFDNDPLAPSKNGLIGWLKTEIEKPQPKAETKELSKQEQKKLRQQKKTVNLDLTIDTWMDDLKIKPEDIETIE